MRFAANVYQAEILRDLFELNKYSWVPQVCRVVEICSVCLVSGLCVWYDKDMVGCVSFATNCGRFPIQSAQLSTIFKTLLFSTSAVYFGLFAANIYLCTVAITSQLFFRVNSALCFLIFAPTCISVGLTWSNSGGLVITTWVKISIPLHQCLR